MHKLTKKARKRFFWITLVVFLALCITPLAVLYRQMQAEVGYWFSDSSTESSQVEDMGELSEQEVAQFSEGTNKDMSIVANIDRDEDGIPDYAETAIWNINPNSKDTDGDGYDDWDEIKNGYDPNSLFKEKIDLDGDWLKDAWEIDRYDTNPKIADSDGDSIGDGEEIASGSDPKDAQVSRINPDLEPYTLSINKIGAEAPIVFGKSRDENDIYEDLKSGFVHYYNTALPGERGDTDFFCHSSAPFGSDGNFDTLCANLDKLERGDEIIVSSETNKMRYVVTSRKNDYDPGDPKIFRKTDRDSISIISCWPAGTNNKRIVIRAENTSL
ncbi:sortase domain-bontaining protein [Patescibacteria group bacterium]